MIIVQQAQMMDVFFSFKYLCVFLLQCVLALTIIYPQRPKLNRCHVRIFLIDVMTQYFFVFHFFILSLYRSTWVLVTASTSKSAGIITPYVSQHPQRRLSWKNVKLWRKSTWYLGVRVHCWEGRWKYLGLIVMQLMGKLIIIGFFWCIFFFLGTTHFSPQVIC